MKDETKQNDVSLYLCLYEILPYTWNMKNMGVSNITVYLQFQPFTNLFLCVPISNVTNKKV